MQTFHFLAISSFSIFSVQLTVSDALCMHLPVRFNAARQTLTHIHLVRDLCSFLIISVFQLCSAYVIANYSIFNMHLSLVYIRTNVNIVYTPHNGDWKIVCSKDDWMSVKAAQAKIDTRVTWNLKNSFVVTFP